MKPRDFFKRFDQVCSNHQLSRELVWQLIPFDELDWLQQGSEQAWETLETCLKEWKHKLIEAAHETPYPGINCKTCKHFNLTLCEKYAKPVPKEYIAKGCKEWNV